MNIRYFTTNCVLGSVAITAWGSYTVSQYSAGDNTSAMYSALCGSLAIGAHAYRKYHENRHAVTGDPIANIVMGNVIAEDPDPSSV